MTLLGKPRRMPSMASYGLKSSVICPLTLFLLGSIPCLVVTR